MNVRNFVITYPANVRSSIAEQHSPTTFDVVNYFELKCLTFIRTTLNYFILGNAMKKYNNILDMKIT